MIFESSLIVAPVLLEGVRLGVLTATKLHGELHAVGEEVVEVLHATLYHVPLGSIGDPARHRTVRKCQKTIELLNKIVNSTG